MALVFVVTLGVIPALGWLVQRLFGWTSDAYTAYYLGAIIGWIGLALLK
jgi:hypothetical protein